ncbi:MAG: Rrf2 family transcriptional regulator [Saprospiraceae bacterium]|nr:Rrf2 family transcriptional regulator [Saprospiraceae bacterium]
MFSKSCKYGIRAVLYLAIHTKEGEKKGVKEIAEVLHIPQHFLAKILQELSRQGFVSSIKGPHGGFYLSEENLEQPLLNIIEAIDGKEALTSCILGLPVCSSEHPCPLHSKSVKYRNGLLELVGEQSIKDLAINIELKNLTL